MAKCVNCRQVVTCGKRNDELSMFVRYRIWDDNKSAIWLTREITDQLFNLCSVVDAHASDSHSKRGRYALDCLQITLIGLCFWMQQNASTTNTWCYILEQLHPFLTEG